MSEQKKMFSELRENENATESVEKYEFEPIQGYPMLHWKGKRPFRSTQYYPSQLKETYGEPVDGWINRIYWGDNLQVMSHLLKEFRGNIQLIYIDPPFDSKADYKKTIKLIGKEVKNDHIAFEEKQYTDIWTNDEYLQFMYERLVLLRELLSNDGAIYLHCDWHKGHHLKCILDEVFGIDNFQNEIAWGYKTQGASKKRWSRKHDTILFYTKKSESWIFNVQYERSYMMHKYGFDKDDFKIDEDGRQYRDAIVRDFWEIPAMQSGTRENLPYPTQKPEALVERIIKASSNPGDLVFDGFMGSGTTQAVAMKLGRRFIGADINIGSIQITTKRLLKISEEMIKDNPQRQNEGEQPYYTSFSVYNVNHYDVFRNPVQAKDLLIEALEIQPFQHSAIYDGEKDGRMVKIMPVNRIATRADLNELISNFDYKTFEKRKAEQPNKAVEKILLVSMGHEPDLAGILEKEAGYKLDVKVVDILRDKSNLEFKRDSEASVFINNGHIAIQSFYPMNLLQKLSLMKENVEDWRELVESIMIDWNYDGETLRPDLTDIPGKNELVKGIYSLPKLHENIRIKITDLLSESWEGGVQNG
jgi:site-specific DNA-methyltransferase (adenine-specific)/adenine-specific DNA-methyltransferase